MLTFSGHLVSAIAAGFTGIRCVSEIGYVRAAKKGDWVIVFDTSSWTEVGTINTPRVLDVPVPGTHLMQWTESLISHLCETTDALNKS